MLSFINKKFATRLTYLFLFFLIVFSLILGFKNVNTDLDSTDIYYFNLFNIEKKTDDSDFRREITIIRSLQNTIFDLSPVNSQLPDGGPREIADLVKNKAGLCFDRSRSIDKGLKYLGFETRHVFLLYKGSGWSKFFPFAIINRGSPSHAITEVRTSRGWLAVDSYTKWIALDPNGNPVESENIYSEISYLNSTPQYFKEPYWVLKGFYTRGGRKYPPYWPIPELNWPPFFKWLIQG